MPRLKTERTLDECGRTSDGGPIRPGDVFRTVTGRETSPFPPQKREQFASMWLITNAVAEAKARLDDFNAAVFGQVAPLRRDGILAGADRDSMLMYLFAWQPPVVPRLLRPLTQQPRP